MIQNVSRKSLTLSLQKFDWPMLLRYLAEAGHVGLIFGIKNELLDRFGLRVDQVQSASLYPTRGAFFGDIFFPNSSSTLYLKASGHRQSEDAPVTEANVWDDPGASTDHQLSLTLEAGEIVPISSEDTDKLGNLIQAVNSYLTASGLKDKLLEWKDVRDAAATTPPFPSSPAKMPDQKSLELAAIFRDGRLGTFLDKFAGDTRSIVLDDFLSTVSNREETEYYIDKLFEADFISEEIVVYCRKTGAPTIRAKDRVALDALSGAGISCSCGEPLQNENIRRLIILPEKNRPLASSTWAAQTFLINILSKLGYKAGQISLSENGRAAKLAFVPTESKNLLIAMAPGNFDDQAAREIFSVIGKKPDGYKVILYGAAGIENNTLEKLESKFGKDSVLALPALEDFSTKLLETLNKERLSNVVATFMDFQNQLNVDIASLAMARFGD